MNPVCPECGTALAPGSSDGLCAGCHLAGAAELDDAPTQLSKELTPGAQGVAALVVEKPGDWIGRYKLLQQLGEGGCGIVYMAEQQEPVKRRVALKLIKLGMDTRAVVARFEAERQALALMDHENIAKVLDGGATTTGRPYFVMELVRGIPITRYCDENRLDTRQRLQLFIRVCQAIQHAHQKGIIHRDVKPSNILVADYDGKPVPKVIDFGVAKATAGQTLTDKTLFTAFEQFIGTPAYMSPEQAKLSGLDIDTRSDIYSLGVLLYELLTGRTPFDPKRLMQAGFDEVRRIIREEDPLRPSTRLSTLDMRERTAVAKSRHSEPPKLLGLLRGDLDWIVMKTLEKDRNRRYETANGLAMDVQRFLADEPVVARPPSRLYEFRKTVRRHKLGFAATAAVVLALSFGLAALAYGFQRVKAERDLERSESYASDLRLCSQWLLWSRYAQCRHLLQANVPRPGERDLRSFEWWYYWRLCRGDDVAPMGPVPSSLRGLGFLSGDRLIAGASQVRAPLPGSLSSDGDGLFVWDWKSRRLLRFVNYGGVSDLSVSPDGRRLALATWDNKIRILDAESYAVVTNYLCTNVVTDLAFSPDGSLLAARGEDCLYLYDLKANAPAEVLPAFENQQEKPAFSPDGRLVVFMLPDGRLGLWDVREHRFNARLPNAAQAHLSGQNGLKPLYAFTGRHAFSPDGKLLASGDIYGRIMIHNLESGAVRLIWEHFGYFALVTFSPDGKTLASGSADGFLKLWDPVTGLELATYHGHDSAIESITFTPSGDFVLTGGRDGYIRVWDAHPASAPRNPFAETGIQFNPALLATQQNSPYFSVPLGRAFSPNGRLLYSPADGRPAPPSRRDTVQQFDAGTEHAISPDARYVVFRATNGVCRLTDLESGAEIASYTPSPGEHIGAVSPNGRWVAASFDNGRLVLREPRLAGARAVPDAHSGRVTAIEFSPPGNALATASRDGWLKVWDLRDLRLLAQARMPGETHFEGPKALAFSRDGAMVACGEGSDTRTVILDLARPLEPRVITMPFEGWSTRALAFSPDRRLLAAGGYSDRAALFDVRSGRRVALVGNEVFESFEVAQFTPDSRRLALACGGTITLWDLESKRNVLAISTSGDAVIDQMRINQAGDRIAVTLNDGTCRIYSAARDE